MEEKTKNNADFSIFENEIDLLKVVRVTWERRKVIYFFAGLFFLFGILFSFLQSPAQFKSETTFLLKSSSNGVGNGIGSLGGLATIAGISLPSGGFSSGIEIPPSLYSKFISSIEFKKALIDAPISVEGQNEKVTYAYYYEQIAKPSRLELVKTYTLGLPAILWSKIKPNNSINTSKKADTHLIMLSSTEKAHFARLDDQLKIESKDGVIFLSFTMPEPLMAAQMADFSFQLLQKEIISYKLGNILEELRFSEALYEEKKQEFYKIQNELGYFRDRNQNVISSSGQNQMERLQAEYNIKMSVFTQVANALESTKLQMAKDTPIFSILDPVTIPNSSEATRGTFLILFSTIFGIVVAIVFIFLEQFLNGVRNKWS